MRASRQGGVYSTNGWSGSIEDGSGKTIDAVPLSGTGYGQSAGLSGLNGHMSSSLIAGVSVLRPGVRDDEEKSELYKHTQERRYMERKIRKLRREAGVSEAAGDTDGEKELRTKSGGQTEGLR